MGFRLDILISRLAFTLAALALSALDSLNAATPAPAVSSTIGSNGSCPLDFAAMPSIVSPREVPSTHQLVTETDSVTGKSVSYSKDPRFVSQVAEHADREQMLNVDMTGDTEAIANLMAKKYDIQTDHQKLAIRVALDRARALGAAVSIAPYENGGKILIDIPPPGTSIAMIASRGSREGAANSKIETVRRLEVEIFDNRIVLFDGSAGGPRVGNTIQLDPGASHSLSLNVKPPIEPGQPITISSAMGPLNFYTGRAQDLADRLGEPVENVESLWRMRDLTIEIAKSLQPDAPIEFDGFGQRHRLDRATGEWVAIPK